MFSHSRVAFLLFAAMAASSSAVGNDTLTVALSFKPRQADADYDIVKPEEVSKCSIEEMKRHDGEGFWIVGPGGQPLRWFVDTNGDNKPDRWCYFSNGVEVYREIDTNFNKTADQYRWFNTEGMRWGIDDNEDGTIDRWQMISAEEVSAEVIKALAENDPAKFNRLLLNEKELQSLGLGEALTKSIQDRVKSARESFPAWMKKQRSVTPNSSWTNFGADKPGIVPAGSDGSIKDIVVYENAVALFTDGNEARQLIVGTMIQVEGAWRLASLPRLVGDESTVDESGTFFTTSYAPRSAISSEGGAGMSKSLEALVNQLQEVDKKLAVEQNKEPWHAQRADILEKLVSHSDTAAEQTTWIEQFADTVSAAAQIGEYTGGIDRLKDFHHKLENAKASDDRLAYVAYRMMTAAHNVQMQAPDAKFEELNERFLDDLEKFINTFPKSKDTAEAILQIALASELTGEPKDAAQWYARASETFPNTDAGKRASGALNRLNLVGKPLQLSLPTLDGKSFKSTDFRDGPVVYYLWASNCISSKADMRVLKELQAKYAKHKLRVVGLNFDRSPEKGLQFLKENSNLWLSNGYDKGGMDSNLAISLGIQVLPVSFVVDSSGKVVRTGVHSSEIEQVVEELLK